MQPPPHVVWTLWKGGRRLRLTVQVHPYGRELRLHEGDELRRSQVVRDQEAMLDLAVTWRELAEAKGWREVVHDRPMDA